MQYALIENIKREATPELRWVKALCPTCGSPVIAHCGKIQIWHWKHKSTLECDRWSERETQWHRNWKSHYPHGWQEVTVTNVNGEKHRADVMRPDGFCLEFQHSPISDEEIQLRNNFYKNIAWIVDGSRLVSDLSAVENHLKELDKNLLNATPLNLRILKKFQNTGKPIFIDFQEAEERIFYLLENHQYKLLYQISISEFIQRTETAGKMKPLIDKAKEEALIFIQELKKKEFEQKQYKLKEAIWREENYSTKHIPWIRKKNEKK